MKIKDLIGPELRVILERSWRKELEVEAREKGKRGLTPKRKGGVDIA